MASLMDLLGGAASGASKAGGAAWNFLQGQSPLTNPNVPYSGVLGDVGASGGGRSAQPAGPSQVTGAPLGQVGTNVTSQPFDIGKAILEGAGNLSGIDPTGLPQTAPGGGWALPELAGYSPGSIAAGTGQVDPAEIERLYQADPAIQALFEQRGQGITQRGEAGQQAIQRLMDYSTEQLGQLPGLYEQVYGGIREQQGLVGDEVGGALSEFGTGESPLFQALATATAQNQANRASLVPMLQAGVGERAAGQQAGLSEVLAGLQDQLLSEQTGYLSGLQSGRAGSLADVLARNAGADLDVSQFNVGQQNQASQFGAQQQNQQAGFLQELALAGIDPNSDPSTWAQQMQQQQVDPEQSALQQVLAMDPASMGKISVVQGAHTAQDPDMRQKILSDPNVSKSYSGAYTAAQQLLASGAGPAEVANMAKGFGESEGVNPRHTRAVSMALWDALGIGGLG